MDFMEEEIIITGLQNDEALNKYVWGVDKKCLAVFNGGKSKRHCLSVIGKDYLIGSIANTDVLNIWPLNTGEQDGIEIKCPGMVTALDVSPNGRYCIAAIGVDLYLWQVITGELICILPKYYGEVTCVKFSRDGKYFVSGKQCGEVMVWKLSSCMNLETSKDLKPVYTWDNHFEKIIDICVGNINSRAKIAVISRTYCSVYSLVGGHCIMALNPKKNLSSVTMDPAELFVFVGNSDGNVIQFHDFPEYTGNSEDKEICEEYGNVFDLHKCEVTCLSTSKNGQFLLSGSMDSTVKIFNLISLKIIQVIQHTSSVSNAFFSLCPNFHSNSKYKRPPKFIVKPFHFCFKISDERDEWDMHLEPHEVQPVSFIDTEDNLPELEIRSDGMNTNIRKNNELKKINAQLYAYMQNVMSSVY